MNTLRGVVERHRGWQRPSEFISKREIQQDLFMTDWRCSMQTWNMSLFVQILQFCSCLSQKYKPEQWPTHFKLTRFKYYCSLGLAARLLIVRDVFSSPDMSGLKHVKCQDKHESSWSEQEHDLNHERNKRRRILQSHFTLVSLCFARHSEAWTHYKGMKPDLKSGCWWEQTSALLLPRFTPNTQHTGSNEPPSGATADLGACPAWATHRNKSPRGFTTKWQTHDGNVG